MPGLVDIHCHLLPGIDDGPEDLEGSLDMARVAVARGVDAMVATPHLRSDFPDVLPEEIAPRCEQLRQQLDREGVGLEVVSGGEVSLVWALEATDEQLALVSYAGRGTDLLIETPTDTSMIENLLYAIRAKGYRVVLAHPERSPDFQRAPEKLEHLSNQGILLQINARALLRPREAAGRLARELCLAGLAHVVASDGHRSADWRPLVDLPDALEPLSALVGARRTMWMAGDVPRAIIAGNPLPPAPPIQAPARRRSWARRFRSALTER